MAIFTDRFKRSVIPRWHDSQDPGFWEESRSLNPRAPLALRNTKDVYDELKINQSVGVAIDALNSAIVSNDNITARIAADIIHKHKSSLPSPIVKTARQVIGAGETDLPLLQPFRHIHQQKISELRSMLRVYPRSAIMHLDLARHQLILGLTDKSKKSINSALQLQPQNRSVLRSCSRFFVSINETERAYSLIHKSEATKHDPWLIAAEVSIGQILKKSPKYWKQGMAFLTSNSIHPGHLSELAAAAGTIELFSGNIKASKKLFNAGLRAPTENSLAQVRWAEGRFGTRLINESDSRKDVKSAFEAEFFHYYQDCMMKEAFECCEQWFYYEPFSIIAISATIHVAGLLDDYSAVNKYAHLGLHGHINDVNLKNNILYALISSGEMFQGEYGVVQKRIDNVVQELKANIELGGYVSVHAMANLGLLAFRIGHIDEGRFIYERAIQLAQKNGDQHQAASAAVFFARESILSSAPWTTNAVAQARELSKPYTTGVARAPAIEYYMRKIDALEKNPGNADYIISAKSVSDFSTNKPTTPLKITRATDGRYVIWLPK